MEEKTESPHRATAGFAISLIAGILIAIQGVLLLVMASWMEEFMHRWGMSSEMVGLGLGQAIITTMGAMALVFGIIVLLGAFLIYSPGNETLGGILVLVFSIISFLIGGGFFIGAILGIVGGALGLAKK